MFMKRREFLKGTGGPIAIQSGLRSPAQYLTAATRLSIEG